MSMSFPDPFEALLRLQHALDRPRSGDAFRLSTTGAGAFPAVNVFQKEHDFVVLVELPGVDKSTLTIEVQKNHLRLAGKRTPTEATGGSLHRRERAAGDFDRTVTFPVALDPGSAISPARHLYITCPWERPP